MIIIQHDFCYYTIISFVMKLKEAWYHPWSSLVLGQKFAPLDRCGAVVQGILTEGKAKYLLPLSYGIMFYKKSK